MGVTEAGETRSRRRFGGSCASPKARHTPQMRGIQHAAAYPRHCERSEAIRLAVQRKNGLLRFARNDGWFVGWVERSDTHQGHGVSDGFRCALPILRRYDFAFSRRAAPEVCSNSPPRKRRVQGMPGARCTRGLVCNVCIEMRTRAYRCSRNTPAFPAQGLYGLCRALPGDEFLLPPSLPA
jgi:hypothetical protein